MPINQQGKTYEEVYGKSPAINSQTLTQEPDFILPPTQPEQNYDISSIPDLLTQIDQPTASEQKQDSYEARLTQLTQSLSGQTQDQYAEEQKRGIPENQKQLTELMGQIGVLKNEAQAIPLRLQEQATGRGVTAGGLAPIQAAELRKNAINALSLSSVAQALQGNISLAQQQADRAIEVKYAPIQAEIDQLKTTMELNEKRMGREDSKRAQKLNIVLNERQRILDNAREDQKIVTGWAAEAAKLGNAPALILNQALNAKDPRQALAILSPYMSDPNEKEAALLDLDFKREQIKNAQYNRYLQGEELKLAKDKFNFDKELSFAKLQEEADKAVGSNTEANQTRINAIDLANTILGSNTSALTGIPGLGALAPRNALAKNQINQLRAILALENRSKLKGSGAISDYESRVLNQSSSSLGEEGWIRASNLSDTDFTNEIKKVRGVLTVMNGGTTKVLMRSPNGEISPVLDVNREQLNNAVQDGFTVIYQ